MLSPPHLLFLLLLPAALSVSAAPSHSGLPQQMASRQASDAAPPAQASAQARKLLIGGGPTGMVGAADFNGTSFDIVANHTIPGADHSWLLFKEPNLLYAVDENSNNTRVFNASSPV